MATKCRITFYKFKAGVEVDHVSAATMVNSFDDAQAKMQQFAQGRHPEAADVSILRNEKSAAIGVWQIFAQSNSDPAVYFAFIITKQPT